MMVDGNVEKMMKKLKKNGTKKEEVPAEEEVKDVEEVEEVEEDDDADDDDADDDADDKEEEESDPIPAEDEQAIAEKEVFMMQNAGVFRRELILCFRELIAVEKIEAQTLIEIKELIGGKDGKGSDKKVKKTTD